MLKLHGHKNSTEIPKSSPVHIISKLHGSSYFKNLNKLALPQL